MYTIENPNPRNIKYKKNDSKVEWKNCDSLVYYEDTHFFFHKCFTYLRQHIVLLSKTYKCLIFDYTANEVNGKVARSLTGLTTPVGWLLLLQLTALNRSAIVV